jgi:hypothetical protein
LVSYAVAVGFLHASTALMPYLLSTALSVWCGQEEEGAANAAAARADKHQRSELLRAAHISRIRAKAGDETRKVEEVSFINTLNNEGKKADLQQRLEEGERGLAGVLQCCAVSSAEAQTHTWLLSYQPTAMPHCYAHSNIMESILLLCVSALPVISNRMHGWLITVLTCCYTACRPYLAACPHLQVRHVVQRLWQLFLPSRLEQQPASRRRLSAGVQQRRSAWRSWQTSGGASRRLRWAAVSAGLRAGPGGSVAVSAAGPPREEVQATTVYNLLNHAYVVICVLIVVCWGLVMPTNSSCLLFWC